jgi:DNA-directed RNA polymerase subunit N (RpoN/RPB10)
MWADILASRSRRRFHEVYERFVFLKSHRQKPMQANYLGAVFNTHPKHTSTVQIGKVALVSLFQEFSEMANDSGCVEHQEVTQVTFLGTHYCCRRDLMGLNLVFEEDYYVVGVDP